MLEAYRKLKTKPKTSAELKEAVQVILGNLSQGPINKAVKDFSNKATGGWCCSLELAAGFSIDLNFQDVVTSKLKKLDVSVQNLEFMQ